MTKETIELIDMMLIKRAEEIGWKEGVDSTYLIESYMEDLGDNPTLYEIYEAIEIWAQDTIDNYL